MSNAEDYNGRLQELRRRQDALYFSNQSQRASDLLAFYTRIMTRVTDSERCSVFINDPTQDRVWLKAGTGVQESEIEVPRAGSIVGEVIASGEPVVISDLEMKSGAHKEVDRKTGFVTRNILCVPIKSSEDERVTGAFQILNKRNNGDFTDDDKVIALDVAQHMQREVDTVFLDQEIFRLSDGLQSSAVRTKRMMYASIGVSVVLLIGVVMMGGA